jgi:hypothetical protein
MTATNVGEFTQGLKLSMLEALEQALARQRRQLERLEAEVALLRATASGNAPSDHTPDDHAPQASLGDTAGSADTPRWGNSLERSIPGTVCQSL